MSDRIVLPFPENEITGLYEKIAVPHPIGFNPENHNLALVVNDLSVPGVGFFFDVPKTMEITSPADGLVERVLRNKNLSTDYLEAHESETLRTLRPKPLFDKPSLMPSA